MAKIIYVMGPSASGKDSILAQLKAVSCEYGFFVSHRYITRACSATGENHIELSLAEFEFRKRANLFHYAWAANGHHYGIGIEVRHWLEQGLDVVVSGSRAHYATLSESEREELLAINISANNSIRLDRLIARGRESQREIEARFVREPTLPDGPIYQVDNSTELVNAVSKILDIIKTYESVT